MKSQILTKSGKAVGRKLVLSTPCGLGVVFSLVFSPMCAQTPGGNPKTYQTVKIPFSSVAYWYDQSSITEVYEVSGASITYTISAGSSETTTDTIGGNFGTEAEASVSFSTAKGISSERIKSVTLNKSWVQQGSSGPYGTPPVDSTKAFAAYTPTFPWQFDSWIVGPPPTDKKEGNPVVTPTILPGGSPHTRLTTTIQKYSFSIQFKESR